MPGDVLPAFHEFGSDELLYRHICAEKVSQGAVSSLSKKTYNLVSAVACVLLLLALLVVMIGMGYDESAWSVAAIPLSLLGIATLVIIVIMERTSSH